MKRRILCLLSGGYDSQFLCRYAQEQGDVQAVFIRYGQPAVVEEEAAARQFSELINIPLHIRELEMLGLEGMRAPSGEAGPRIVPVRNLLFLSVAANLAATIDCNEVWYGATAEDTYNYPDCRSGFVMGANTALAAYGLRAAAPLVRRTRSDMIRYARDAGWTFSDAWSCYAPAAPGVPCGTCNSCLQPTTTCASTTGASSTAAHL